MFDLSQKLDAARYAAPEARSYGVQVEPGHQIRPGAAADRRCPESAASALNLRRPRLLMRAAVAGQQTYDRGRDLRRLLAGALPTPRQAVEQLQAAELRDEYRRAIDSAAYSAQHHVAVLTALLAEQRLVQSAERAQQAAQGPVPQDQS